jgi:hypothetical protein
MKTFSMLEDIDFDRLKVIGGKAAILERIIQKMPNAPIPHFQMVDEKGYFVANSNQNHALRSSSLLDVFGGCGLFETYLNVNKHNLDSVLDKLYRERLIITDGKVELFAESISQEPDTPKLMSQVQGSANNWGTMMRHPDLDDVVLVAYSDSPSRESKNASLSLSALKTSLSQFGRQRTDYAVIKDGSITETGAGQNANAAITAAYNMYKALEDLDVVSDDWVSIMEFGFSDSGLELYQFTPIRKKSSSNMGYSKDNLIFGKSEKCILPVVLMPNKYGINLYVSGRCDLNDYPHFEAFIRAEVEEYRDLIMHCPQEPLLWNYVRAMDLKYPDGYIVLARTENNQDFDIPMRNAKAVFLGYEGYQGLPKLLNHSISRLIAKSPLLVVSSMDSELFDSPHFFQTGDLVIMEPTEIGYNISKLSNP